MSTSTDHPSHDPSSGRTRDIGQLPLFAQALVASRLARRACLAMMHDAPLGIALAACDAIDAVARAGDGWRETLDAPKRARSLPRTGDTEAALEAVRWAFDAAGAAQGALDFPVDAVVTNSARRSIDAVMADPRVSALQVMIVLAADIDQVAFACREAHVRTYDGVGAHVLSRLAPCHALTLQEPRRPAQEDMR
jgi:hypothetical protein